MYTWIWQHLRGSRRARIAQSLMLFTAVTVLCFVVVFPALGGLWAPADTLNVPAGH